MPFTSESAKAAAAKRTANKAARLTSEQAANLAAAPPNPPSNYGIGSESRGLPGGAIDPATRDIGIDLGAKLAEANNPNIRPLVADVVGDLSQPAPVQPPVKVAKSESDLPFKSKVASRKPVKPNGHRTPSPIISTADPEPIIEGTTLQLPDWQTVNLQEGQDILDSAYKLLEAAGKVLQVRQTQREADAGYHCKQCGKPVPDLRMAKMVQAHRDLVTGIFTNVVWCSHRCFTGFVAGGQASSAKET